LEYLRDVKGIPVYNDNNATTPEATIVGIEALGDEEKKNIILIMGGADKGIDCTELIEKIEQFVKKVFLIPGTGTDKVVALLKVRSLTSYSLCATLKEAMTEAVAVGLPEDVLLFSPAFASFGQYKNEYERNDEFVHIIESYE
jgi:UDP-N-acetylmuramoylalanine--D-glutamate ligase